MALYEVLKPLKCKNIIALIKTVKKQHGSFRMNLFELYILYIIHYIL